MRPARKSSSSSTRTSRSRLVTRAVELGGRERGREPLRRGLARGRPRDHLGEERVVERADDRAVGVARVDAHTLVLRDAEPVQRAAHREVAGGDVLGVEARLDRVTRHRRAAYTSGGNGSPCAIASWSATRSRPVTNSVTGCSTCSRVFTSRNQKPPLSGCTHELDRPRVHVADRLRRGHRGVAQLGAPRVVERDRRRLFDDLLVSALDRALALEEVHDRPVRGHRTPAPRRGAAARRIARGTRCRRRTRTPPRVAPSRRRRRAPPASRPRASRGRRRRTRPSRAPGSRSRRRPRRAPHRSCPRRP